MSDYRLLQVFLSPTARGVYEVSADETGRLHCTCPGFGVRRTCKHLGYVIGRLVDNDGEYTIAVPANLAADICADAMRSPESFREFVLRFGTVEVL